MQPARRALVASAAVMTGMRIQRGLPANAKWQDEGWLYYDAVPELRFGTNWLRNANSRCRLGAAVLQPGGDEPAMIDVVDDPDNPELNTPELQRIAVDLMDALAGGTQGQSQMLGSFAVHLTVPGAGYLAGVDLTKPGSDPMMQTETTWQVLSTDEVRKSPNAMPNLAPEAPVPVDVLVDDGKWEPLGDDGLLVRVWRPHERFHYQPDSPTRAALVPLRELDMLTKHVDAQGTSRLAGAGILVLPQSVEFSGNKRDDGTEVPFAEWLGEAMTTPIQNRDDQRAVVPITIQVPDDVVDKIHHITFSTPLDGAAEALRTEAIKRVANGMDLPAEIVLGLADSNHWTAWQIDESALKLHVEPMLETICQGLTLGYLRAGLRAAVAQRSLSVTDDEIDNIIVWYDTSELKVRPDRTGDAKDLFDRQAIGVSTLRRESGFSDDDSPSDDELKRQLLIGVVSQAPSLAPIVLPMLGIPLTVPDADPLPIGGTQTTTPGTTVPPPDALPPEGAPPEQPDGPPTETPPPGAVPGASSTAVAETMFALANEAALLAASDALVTRALERAGNRLRSLTNGKRPAGFDDCPPDQAHCCIDDATAITNLDHLLASAWDRVPMIAERYDVDADVLTATLDGYCRALIAARQVHDYDRLSAVLGG